MVVPKSGRRLLGLALHRHIAVFGEQIIDRLTHQFRLLSPGLARELFEHFRLLRLQMHQLAG